MKSAFGRRRLLAFTLSAAAFPSILAAKGLPKARPVRPGKLSARMKDWSVKSEASLRQALQTKVPHVVIWYREVQTEKKLALSELDLLFYINQTVNSTITYRPDWEHWHRPDHWAPVVTAILKGGDCEAYALCKSAALHIDGWPRDRVRLLVGLLKEGEKPVAHAVLLATTKDGREYVLDNLGNRILPVAEYAERFEATYSIDASGNTSLYLSETKRG